MRKPSRWAIPAILAVAGLLVVTVAQARPSAAPAATERAAVAARVRCSPNPKIAARYIIPPAPFKAHVVSVVRRAIPEGEPIGRGPKYKRLYMVTFDVLRGNAVLQTGERYSQFSYVRRKTLDSPWCFVKGGSGP